jgi:hypothetical protein
MNSLKFQPSPSWPTLCCPKSVATLKWPYSPFTLWTPSNTAAFLGSRCGGRQKYQSKSFILMWITCSFFTSWKGCHSADSRLCRVFSNGKKHYQLSQFNFHSTYFFSFNSNHLSLTTLSRGAPVWFLSLDSVSSAVERMQMLQNSAMQVITGSHKMASHDHFLAETKLLPVEAHLGMVCSQFLGSASRASHLSNLIIKIPTGQCKGRKGIVHTLQSGFRHIIQPFLKEERNLPKLSYKRVIRTIHTAVVTEEKQKLTSKALGTGPLDVIPEESSLPRYARTILNQIRSTYSNTLRSYQARIGSAPDDLCPVCQYAEELHTLQSTCSTSHPYQQTSRFTTCGHTRMRWQISFEFFPPSMTSLLTLFLSLLLPSRPLWLRILWTDATGKPTNQPTCLDTPRHTALIPSIVRLICNCTTGSCFCGSESTSLQIDRLSVLPYVHTPIRSPAYME